MCRMGGHVEIQRLRMRRRKHGLMKNVPKSSFLVTDFIFNTQDDPILDTAAHFYILIVFTPFRANDHRASGVPCFVIGMAIRAEIEPEYCITLSKCKRKRSMVRHGLL